MIIGVEIPAKSTRNDKGEICEDDKGEICEDDKGEICGNDKGEICEDDNYRIKINLKFEM